MNSMKDKAIYYWQDKLAKFFPTLSGPNTCEIDMYKAGYRQALIDSVKILQQERGVWADIAATPKILALGELTREELDV